jgi:hypothetical protein
MLVLLRSQEVKLLPEGGGWGAVADAALKGALLFGFFGVLGPVMATFGLFLYNRGRKVSSPSASKVLDHDTRAPVLYLRSFLDDDVASSPSPARNIGGAQVFTTAATQEEQVAAVLSSAGPVVAVGRPGESLPELGATRLYFQDNEWRDEVSALMQRARLIVIRAGSSENLLWEIMTAVRMNRPQQSIFLIPLEPSKYDQFTALAGSLLPHGLPPWPSGFFPSKTPPELANLDIKAVVHFDSDWHGTLNVLRPTKASTRGARPLEKTFAEAIQPVFRTLGITLRWPSAWNRAAKALGATVAYVTAVIVGVAIVVSVWPSVERVSRAIYTLRVFSKTRVQQVAEMPGPFGPALSAEIKGNRVVRTWLESATNNELAALGSRVADGMPRVSDAVLNERAELFAKLLNSVDTQTCAALIRSMSSGTSPRSDRVVNAEAASTQGADLVDSIYTKLGSSAVRQFAAISVKAMEADLTRKPMLLPSRVEFSRGFQELLDQLSAEQRRRMVVDLRRYGSLPGDELCWLERTVYRIRPRLTPSSQSAILRGALGTKP